MNRPTDHEHLLADVFAGEDAAGFRDALFRETLRLARRQRHFRQARRVAPVVAMLAGLALVVWRTSPPQVAPVAAIPKPYAVVLSQPLPAAALVITRPLAIRDRVAALPNVQMVETVPGRGPREISDDELLALAEPKPAALVRLGPHTAELIVLNSTDQAAPPPN